MLETNLLVLTRLAVTVDELFNTAKLLTVMLQEMLGVNAPDSLITKSLIL